MKLVGSNSGHAAAQNRDMIVNLIHRGAPLSRTELAQRSGLTKQAVTRIVDRLLDEEVIMEARRRHGMRGQPAIELEINPEGVYSIGANIDRDHLTIVAIDATGCVRGRIHHEKRFLLPEQFIQLMKEGISDFCRRKLVREERLAGIGLAIPDWLGEVPVIGFPDAYHKWSGFDVRKALALITDLPIFIDNDANAAAAGEVEYGLGTEINNFFYVLVNACLGGGLIIERNRHKGANGLSGEIGWYPVLCDEGARAGEVLPVGDVVSLFILMDYLRQNGIDIASPADLVRLDPNGRRLVTAWLRKASTKLAEAIINIGMLVDPEAILFGGRLPVRIIDELLIYIRDEMNKMGVTRPSLHRAACSEDAAALGAATMPLACKLGLPTAEEIQRVRAPLSTSGPISDYKALTAKDGKLG